jgi:MFS family permease
MEITAARQSQTAVGYLRWLIVIVPFLMWFFGTGEKLNVGVVIANKPFLEEMNLVGHNPTLGSLTSWFLIGYGVSALPWGFVIDRIGTRNTALLATLLDFIAMIWFGMGTNTLQLQTSRLLLGISEGVLHPFSNALIARWFPFKERGRATGIWWCAVRIRNWRHRADMAIRPRSSAHSAGASVQGRAAWCSTFETFALAGNTSER